MNIQPLILLPLPLLSIATMAGVQAPAAPIATLDVADGAVGAEARGEPGQIRLPDPVAPKRIELRCPLISGFTRTVDLSSGTANWLTQGPDIPTYLKPRDLGTEALPSASSAPIPGPSWLQLHRRDRPTVTEGSYSFSISFQVVKSPGEMRVMLKGRVLADEKFSVELIEPNLPNAAPDNPSQWGTSAEAPDPAQLTPKDVFDVDLLVGEASGSKNPRVGEYRVVVTVENTAGYANAIAIIAQLELKQTCLNWGGGKKPKKRR